MILAGNMRFEFTSAERIIFGPGTLSEIGPAAARIGQRALVTLGVPQSLAQPLINILDVHGVSAVFLEVKGEPSLDLVQRAINLSVVEKCDLLIGFGGGSAIDTAKAAAALLTNAGEILDYLEVVGKGRPIIKQPAPWIAVPTTAGTGAEVTRNAVLYAPEQKVKVSLRSPLMLARLALVDPELTYNLPPEVTASTGLDALTQLIEPFVSVKANPFTDAFCREGMPLAASSLLQAYHDGHDAKAREDMSLASLLGGLALANAALGAVHGFAGPIGGMFPAPHGAICARLLPLVMEANIRALQLSGNESNVLRRYDEVARILTGKPSARAEDGAARVREIVQELQVPQLSKYGVKTEDIPGIVEKSARASSMKGNPVQLSLEELAEIMEAAI